MRPPTLKTLATQLIAEARAHLTQIARWCPACERTRPGEGFTGDICSTCDNKLARKAEKRRVAHRAWRRKNPGYYRRAAL